MISKIGEFGLIRRLLSLSPPFPDDVVVGPGDDCAVIRMKKGKSLLMTTDMLIEGVHFRREWMTATEIGAKAMRVNLSDIAAMGGAPRFALIAVGMPASFLASDAMGLFRGIQRIARETGVSIVGGDTNRADRLIVNITLVGEAEGNRFLTRKGAQVGDRIYVTGTLGDSALGLKALKKKGKKAVGYQPFIRRHLSPPCRLAIGQRLSRIGLVHSLIDLSDGLTGDLGHILEESGVGAEIVVNRIPVSSTFHEKARKLRLDPEILKLAGGEDYELLLTASPRAKIPLQMEGVPVTSIGRILPKKAGLRLVDSQGRLFRKKVSGFRHFS